MKVLEGHIRRTFRMAEENNPFVANELMEVDRALGRLRFEVWGRGAEAKRSRTVRHIAFGI